MVKHMWSNFWTTVTGLKISSKISGFKYLYVNDAKELFRMPTYFLFNDPERFCFKFIYYFMLLIYSSYLNIRTKPLKLYFTEQRIEDMWLRLITGTWRLLHQNPVGTTLITFDSAEWTGVLRILSGSRVMQTFYSKD